MTPAFFFLSLVSITTIWAISTVGLPSYYWNYFVVPCVSVFCLCDHQKLSRELAREFKESFWGVTISVAILSSAYVGYLPWKKVILLCCIFCLGKAFSFEKMMYSGDVCGELAKFVWWRTVVRRVIRNQFDRMTWKGDWAYCSPYSRQPLHKTIDFYYILSEPLSREARIPEPFNLQFSIEDCKVVCEYSPAGGDCSSSESAILSTTAVADTRGEPSAQPACVAPDEGPSCSESPEDRAAGDIDGSSSSETGDVEVPVENPNMLEVAQDEGASSSQSPGGAAGAEDGSSTSKTGDVEVPVLYQGQVNKLEVTLSLQEGDAELETFTFFDIEGDRVVAVKRAMEVLEDHENLIFSSFHRNIGSRTPRAHARCYQFDEIFELILFKGYTVQRVNLSCTYSCSISGRMVIHILNAGLLVWMTYYQVTAAGTAGLITMLVLLGLIHFSLLFLDAILANPQAAKRCLYSLISWVRPERVDDDYKYFQVRCPIVTFCNQSYGYPYTFDCRVICCFRGMRMRTRGARHEYLPTEDLFDVGQTIYGLRNVNLLLDIRPDNMDELVVGVTLVWARNDEEFYCNLFPVSDRRKVSNLISVLRWLAANNYQGVCKKWEKDAMCAFTYEELVCKILDERDYYPPWLIHFDCRQAIVE